VPALEIRVLVHLKVHRSALDAHLDIDIPHHEGQVCKGALVANEPGAVVQDAVEDAGDAVDFVDVAHDGGLEPFGVEEAEPRGLAEIGALARGLEVGILLQEVFFGDGSVRELLIFVVLVDQVEDDGAGLPQGDAGVGIVD